MYPDRSPRWPGLPSPLGASCRPAQLSNITLPPRRPILDKIYSFDLEGAVESREERMSRNCPIIRWAICWSGSVVVADLVYFRRFQVWNERRPARPKLEADRHYFELAAKALKLAESQIKQSESAEMQFYAGMAEASSARLYGLRGENANAARSGCGGEHLQRAKALDPDLADADLGLGLYNYYVTRQRHRQDLCAFSWASPAGQSKKECACSNMPWHRAFSHPTSHASI